MWVQQKVMYPFDNILLHNLTSFLFGSLWSDFSKNFAKKFSSSSIFNQTNIKHGNQFGVKVETNSSFTY